MVQASTKRQTIIYYDGISSQQFRSLNEIYLYIYIITGPIGIYIIDKKFSLGIFLACFFQGIGSILLYFSASNFWLNFYSNAFVALAQSLMFPAPAFMAERYFSKKIAPLVVCLPLYFMMLGNGLAQWFPIFYMDDTLDKNIIYDRYSTIKILGMFAGLPVLLLYIPFWLWPITNKNERFSDKKHKDSLEEAILHNAIVKKEEPIGLIKGTFLTLTSLIPLTNLLMGSVANGLWGTFCTISNSIMVDFGYSDQFSGLISLIYVLLGTVYASWISYHMDTKKKIDQALKVFSLLLA